MSDLQVILEHQLAELVAEWSDARERKRQANQEFNEEIKNLEEQIDGLLGEIKVEQRADEAGQQRLPFERPVKPPTILPAEEPLSDPDLQALASLARLHGIVAARRNENGSTTFTLRADSGFESTITLRKNEHGAIVYDSDDQAPPRPDSGSVNENQPNVNAEAESVNAEAESVNAEAESVNAEAESVNAEPHEPTQEEREEMLAPKDTIPEDLACATCDHYSQFHTGDDILNEGCCTIAYCSCRHFVPPDPLGIDSYQPGENAEEVSDVTT